jgi:hypothetical protein
MNDHSSTNSGILRAAWFRTSYPRPDGPIPILTNSPAASRIIFAITRKNRTSGAAASVTAPHFPARQRAPPGERSYHVTRPATAIPGTGRPPFSRNSSQLSTTFRWVAGSDRGAKMRKRPVLPVWRRGPGAVALTEAWIQVRTSGTVRTGSCAEQRRGPRLSRTTCCRY